MLGTRVVVGMWRGVPRVRHVLAAAVVVEEGVVKVGVAGRSGVE